MASLGHVAVGMAAARLSRPRPPAPLVAPMVFWSLLSMLPDADVLGFTLGISYHNPLGHRGATHSIVFSLAGGVAAGLCARRLRLPALRTGATAFAVLVSHPLLDTLTDGGLGCALFWPFDQTRYFAPWRPIPVAPLGMGFISTVGLRVAAIELILFAPLFAIALWPRGPATRSPDAG